MLLGGLGDCWNSMSAYILHLQTQKCSYGGSHIQIGNAAKTDTFWNASAHCYENGSHLRIGVDVSVRPAFNPMSYVVAV